MRPKKQNGLQCDVTALSRRQIAIEICLHETDWTTIGPGSAMEILSLEKAKSMLLTLRQDRV